MSHSPDAAAAPQPMSILATEERLTRLEMALAHTQHDLDQMHSVLLKVQAELKTSQEQLTRLERRVTTLGEPPETRDSLEERPPHY